MAPERTLPQFLLLELNIIYFLEPSFGRLSGENPIPAEGFARLKRPSEREICIKSRTSVVVGVWDVAVGVGVGGMGAPTRLC